MASGVDLSIVLELIALDHHQRADTKHERQRGLDPLVGLELGGDVLVLVEVEAILADHRVTVEPGERVDQRALDARGHAEDHEQARNPEREAKHRDDEHRPQPGHEQPEQPADAGEPQPSDEGDAAMAKRESETTHEREGEPADRQHPSPARPAVTTPDQATGDQANEA